MVYSYWWLVKKCFKNSELFRNARLKDSLSWSKPYLNFLECLDSTKTSCQTNNAKKKTSSQIHTFELVQISCANPELYAFSAFDPHYINTNIFYIESWKITCSRDPWENLTLLKTKSFCKIAGIAIQGCCLNKTSQNMTSKILPFCSSQNKEILSTHEQIIPPLIHIWFQKFLHILPNPCGTLGELQETKIQFKRLKNRPGGGFAELLSLVACIYTIESWWKPN